MTQAKDAVKVGTNFKWILGVLLTLIFLSVIYVAIRPANIPEGYLSPDEIQEAVDSAVANVTESKDAEIADLIAQLAEKIAEEIEETVGYLIDGIFLNDSFGDVFSDREVTKLFDGKIEFDGDDYDAEETFELSKFEVLANEEDFKGNAYAIVPEGAIKYLFTFETNLNTSEIDEDETLVLYFLGERVEILEWSNDKVTFFKGEEYFLEQGESVTIDGKVVLLDMVLDEAVYVKVDGVGEKIDEGKTKKVNGLEIKVSEVLYSGYSGGYMKATLVIGEDVELTVENEEEYEEDSIWEWVVDDSSLGLILIEEFMELDEEYKPLAPEEAICLPNDYICVKYNGLIEEDFEEYTFDLEEKFVEVKGKFLYEIEDYDRIYIFENGSIYEDDDLDSYIGEKVELGDTDLVISASENRILIKDSVSEDGLVWINLNLTQIQVDRTPSGIWVPDSVWKDITSEEDNFLTDYGILIKNPEDSCEDQYFKIEVPEEKLESTLSVY